MSRNFHNVHVHALTQKKRDQVVRAILAYAKKAGFERVKRVTEADRVIRLGGRAPWFSVEDDAYGAAELARTIAKSTKLPVLEAYCEASSIVWLGLYADGKRAGGWGAGKRPPARSVERLLAKGTPAELATKWDDAIKQVFPETALAVAGKQFGIRVQQLFGETNLRTVVIALARTKRAWKPKYQTGAPGFYVGWGSNSGFDGRHLVFEGDTDQCHRVNVGSTGGPGRGLSITFSGTALDGGHVEILSVSHDRFQLVRDGNSWRDPAAEIPPDFVEQPDTWQMGRREADKVDALKSERSWYIDVSYRAVKEGACELVTDVATVDGKGTGRGALNLQVMWKPWRPSVAHEHVTNDQLFAMHRMDRAIAYVTLRGSLAEAWAWARQPAETWSREDAHRILHVMRDFDVIVREEYTEGEAAPLGKIAPAFPGPTTPFRAASTSWIFGTHSHPPWRMDPREQLAVHLVLASEREKDLARLEAICDDAIRRRVAHSALVVQQEYNPEITTAFEQIALCDDSVARLAAWHETHVRGIDRRIWLSAEHAQLLDRAKLPAYATVTDLGCGLRIQVPDDRLRAELEPLIAALGPLVPSDAEAERWTAARATQLAQLPVPSARGEDIESTIERRAEKPG